MPFLRGKKNIVIFLSLYQWGIWDTNICRYECDETLITLTARVGFVSADILSMTKAYGKTPLKTEISSSCLDSMTDKELLKLN